MNRIIRLFFSLKIIGLLLLVWLLGYPIGYFVLDSNKLTNNLLPTVRGNTEGIGVYIINLDRSKERYQYIKNYAKGLGLKIERVTAIDGTTMTTEEISSKVDLASYKTFLGNFPKRGTIGCCLSHIKAWQTFLSSNLQFALILEDDVSFVPEQLKLIVADLIKNQKFWDIVNLEISHNGFPLKIKNLTNNNYLAVYLTKVTHSGAYIINRKAAKNLLKKALPIKMPIDHYFTRSWELDIKFAGIENPRIVYQTFGDSDIAKTKELYNEQFNILEMLQRRIYKLQSSIIRFFYNLALYFTEHFKMRYEY